VAGCNGRREQQGEYGAGQAGGRRLVRVAVAALPLPVVVLQVALPAGVPGLWLHVLSAEGEEGRAAAAFPGPCALKQ
jgi:hypothetical protein